MCVIKITDKIIIVIRLNYLSLIIYVNVRISNKKRAARMCSSSNNGENISFYTRPSSNPGARPNKIVKNVARTKITL